VKNETDHNCDSIRTDFESMVLFMMTVDLMI